MTVQPTSHLTTRDLGRLHIIRFTGSKVFLDGENTAVIGGELFQLADAFAGDDLLVDLANVSYVSTSGLTMLLQLRKRVQDAGGQLRLANLQPQIKEVFQVTRLDSVFEIDAPACTAALA